MGPGRTVRGRCAEVPNDNPSGAGTFEFNLGFPGQYYDAETWTHYNYFRDYDPTIGRNLIAQLRHFMLIPIWSFLIVGPIGAGIAILFVKARSENLSNKKKP
jgi:hypothetical protein